MDEVSARLRHELVSALRPYVTGRITERGWPQPADVVFDRAESWLAGELDGLLAMPYRQQRRGPLEVFQEALADPTAALAAAGVMPPQRDAAAEAALPGDTFDLAPASSAALGEGAWRAHLAWGAAKAAAMARPVCGVLADNLLDLDQIERSVAAAGYRMERLRSADAVAGQAVLFVDLEHPGADDVIRVAASRGIPAVGFGPHVDDLAMVRARSLGARDAMPRSRFFRDPGANLPKYL